jgi:hypothetical protein
MSKRRTHKPYASMTSEELAEATREFDRPMPGLPGKPLTAAQRRIHQEAKKRGRGRPTVGAGAATVAISIERELLKKADALAKRRKVRRSELFAAAIQAELQRAKAG